MSHKESIDCTLPSVVELIRGGAFNCTYVLPEPDKTAIFFQVVTALLTLVAVGISVWQARKAQSSAKDANAATTAANRFIIEQTKENRYRQASKVSAWIEPEPEMGVPVIHIDNASDEAIYKVSVNHLALPEAKGHYPIMAPGMKKTIGLPNWHKDLPDTAPPESVELVELTFNDALGQAYERLPEHGGKLTPVDPPMYNG